MVQEAPLVAPIRGEHYANLARLGEVIAPPYDVISAAKRAQLASRSPHNIVHLILPESNGDRYSAAAAVQADWRSKGVLVSDSEPAAYVLAQRFTTPDGRTHTRTGL